MADIVFKANEADNAILEAHRQRPPVCSAPSLVWHLAVAPEVGRDPQGARTESGYNILLEKWQIGINKTIQCLSKLTYDKENGFPLVELDSVDGLFSVNAPIQQFIATWGEIQIQVLIEVHFDFVTFTFIVDLRGHEPNKNQENLRNIKNFIANVQSVENFGLEEEAQYLFEGFWLEFRRECLAASGLKETDNMFPGLPFAKFFGLILEEEIQEKWDNSDRFDREGDLNPNATALLKSRWPFVIAANASADDRDIVTSFMLGKRAIYVTAMGARTKKSFLAPRHYSDVQAVRYIIFVRSGADKYQLGRLIEHINTMGTFRLAALKEFSLFRQIGTKIRIYGHLMDEASNKFNELIKNQNPEDSVPEHSEPDTMTVDWTAPPGDPRNPLTFIQETGNIRRLQNALCGIQAQIYLDASAFTGGLSFRVSRASYYVNALKQRLPDLEIERIAPYQSYNAFVRRRLFSVFDYIFDIGERANRLSARISRLLDAIQTKALVDLTFNIQNLNHSTAVQTRALALISSQASIQADEERKQTTVIYVIAVFALASQIIHSALWSYWEDKEALTAAAAYVSASVIGWIFYRIRRSRDKRAKRLFDNGTNG